MRHVRQILLPVLLYEVLVLAIPVSLASIGFDGAAGWTAKRLVAASLVWPTIRKTLSTLVIACGPETATRAANR